MKILKNEYFIIYVILVLFLVYNFFNFYNSISVGVVVWLMRNPSIGMWPCITRMGVTMMSPMVNGL